MYEKHFNLSDSPFTITPNPRYLYLTDQHREALAHLTYGLQENGGFILLTGEVGTGKTTVCRCLLERVPDEVDLAMVLTPTLGVEELLESICQEFGIEAKPGATAKLLTDALNRYLLDTHAKGRRAVVVIDEAQNLTVEVLEQLRLLTNLETNEAKLLQIILIGQPEFLEKLERPELRQLSQRIVARFHLTALKVSEVHAYISHRLKLVGGSVTIFPPAIALHIAQLSKGIPRLINLLCDRSLLGCYVQDRHQVDLKTLRQAAREVFGDPLATTHPPRWRPRYLPRSRGVRSLAALAVFTLLLGMVLVQFEPAWWRAFSQGIQIASVGSAPPQVDRVGVTQPLADETDGTATPSVPPAAVPLATAADIAVPAAAPEEVAVPLTWASLVGMAPTEADAYQPLFRQWKIQYSPEGGKTPCQLAAESQLDCWHKSGNFRDLQRLNRPVLLKMSSDKGKLFYAALLAVGNNTLRLGVGDREVDVPLDEFQSMWTKEFTLLWKRPPGFVGTLRPGEKSSLTAWIEEQMSRFDGRKVGLRQSQVYDFDMSRRVRVLQRRCGLVVDGLVGRETIIMINSLASGVPLLSKRFNRQCKRQLNV